MAAIWLARLEAQEKHVRDDDQLTKLGGEGTVLKKNREEFLQRIQAARKFFMERARVTSPIGKKDSTPAIKAEDYLSQDGLSGA